MKFVAELPDISLLGQEKVFLVGIKGVGMTALALMLQEAGVQVSGADVSEAFVTDHLLAAAHIVVTPLTEAQIPDDCQVVIYSGAHRGRENPLVQDALASGKTALNLAMAVGLLSREKKTIAVCGVGGKSTTSALLSWILSQTENVSASYAVGVGNIPNLGKSGHWDNNSEYFVVEADEYVADPVQDITPRFLYLQPHILICTSMVFDHPDVYADFEDTKRAFTALFRKLPTDGLLVYNGDDQALRELVKSLDLPVKTLSVGELEDNDITLVDWQVIDGVGSVQVGGRRLESQVPGKHNLLNAVYATVVAEQLGVSWVTIERAVREFRSTQRRFEYRGQTVNGTQCFDDYAHHPREIRAIAATVYEWFAGKHVVIAFQPHTYSRTKALRKEFVQALRGSADQVVLLPIFASARENFDESIASSDLVRDLERGGQQALYLEDISAVVELVQTLGPDDVFITVGAGDIYKVYDHVELLHTA